MKLRSLLSGFVEGARIRRKAFVTNAMRIHYSQFGEDIALRGLFGKRRSGFYVDVGCYHPRRFSNTYALHRRGWHGINVDMEPEKIRLFQLARPRDWNIVAAVSDEPRTVTLHRSRKFDLMTTIDESMAEGRTGGETVSIQARTLEDIVATSPFREERIDLLSIDAEGHDFQVLASLDIDARRPEVIIVEEHRQDIESILAGRIYAHLASRGYALCGWTAPSLIFRRRAAAA